MPHKSSLSKPKKLVSHLARLTPRQVRWARKAHATGAKSFTDLLRHFKTVSKTALSFLLSGKTYTNVK